MAVTVSFLSTVVAVVIASGGLDYSYGVAVYLVALLCLLRSVSISFLDFAVGQWQ